MISFQLARYAAIDTYEEDFLPSGREDAEDYVVFRKQPVFDDLVVMVDKATGKIHEEYEGGIRPRLLLMTAVTL